MKLLFLILSLAFCLTGFASTRDKLKKINVSISNLQTIIKKEKKFRDRFQDQLGSIETKAASISKALRDTRAKLRKQLSILNILNNSINKDKSKIAAEKTQLAALLRQAYQLGEEPTLKILLDQSNLEKSQRMLVYYRYLSEAQAKLLAQLQATLAQLKQNQIALKVQTEKLQDLKKTQQAQMDTINNTKIKRLNLVSQINHQLHSRNQKLANLLSDKGLLQDTLRRLNEQGSFSGDFAELKGHLEWPTQGHLLDYFNKPIEHSQLKWEGVVIQAPQDRTVRAIASGKVVFAKWMPGYGLLLIINHGNGYMTLYGRNHYLYKKTGDTVSTGDLIARVGKSGGYHKSALYFAIRHEAKPLDPKKWCH